MACPAQHSASLLPLPTPPQDRAGLDLCLSFPSQHLAWKASAPAAPGKGVQGGLGAEPAAPDAGVLLPGLQGFTSLGWMRPKRRLCCQIPIRKCPGSSLVWGIAARLCFPAPQRKNSRRNT